MHKQLFHALHLTLVCLAGTAQHPDWGLIANPGFEGQSIKSTLFFTGNWRNGIQFYDYKPSDNTGLYTIHPSNAQHLGWSETDANKVFAVQWMAEAGINIINMSYWGLPGTDNWAYWAPMQTSTESHDELFNTVMNEPVLVAPFIESYAATDDYEGFSFADDFPGSSGNPSPKLVEQIEDLIDRYILNPANNQWPSKWARVYDREGNERYLVSVIHVASNQAGITHQEFAQGFDAAADKIFDDLSIRIGFALDILPANSYAPGLFKATASETGSYLAEQSSILAIQCFIPEIWQGESNENTLIQWKSEFSRDWMDTGIPWIHDISSGYDAHIVFPSSPVYGNNERWRYLQDSLIDALNATAFALNAWNGYTEGMSALPTLEYGDTCYNWVCELFNGNCWYAPEFIGSGFANGNSNSLHLHPNPAKELIHIGSDYHWKNGVQCRIISDTGQVLFSEKFHIADSHHELKLGVGFLAPGIYLLVLQDQQQMVMSCMVIMP